MIIVDAHEDIAYNAICFNRDYRRAARETRRLEDDEHLPNGSAMLGLPDAILGRVAVAFATLFVEPVRQNAPMSGCAVYQTPDDAYRLASRQLDYYYHLTDQTNRVNLILTRSDLDETLATWSDGTEIEQHRQGLVVLMENADPIIEPPQLEEWYERGVRIVGPAWSATRYAGGTWQPGPLTRLGYELLDTMQNFNMLLDLSHMAEEAYLQALERYEGAVIASHSNPRHFQNTSRNLSDEMIRLLAERDGVMGIVFYNRYLDGDWLPGERKNKITMSRVVDAIDHVCQVTGSAAHVGIGSDFDGGFGAESTPAEFDTVSDLWNLGAALRKRGYTEADIEAILSGNMLRKLRAVLPTT